ncbi:MAG TPA: enoyl-CoA hydratase/isomerase family protein [Parvularculaceae bacterium]|nr:enoyl-CoA hydratase/isomerase family protein [Parvularculaceae bacterium]
MDHLLVKRRGAIASISFNRPETLNAFTPELLQDLRAALEAIGRDDAVAAIVLEGEGRAFSAGVDLKALKGATPVAGRVASAFDDAAHSAAAAVRSATAPIIAKVHGYCFTGALELALHCDFIMTTADAKFGDTHAKWGLRPTWGMSQNLARAVGVRRARELSFTARTFTGAEAAAWGLANAVFPDKAALDDAVNAQCQAIAAASRGAISAYKKLYRLHEENHALEDALEAEVRMEFPEIADTAERLGGFG